jgi:hypothetical protein
MTGKRSFDTSLQRLAYPPKCPYCGEVAFLRSGKEFFPGKKEVERRNFWSCDPCDAYTGTDPKDNITPVGRLANAELREAKRAFHFCFDPLWKKMGNGRHQSYTWLAGHMGILPEQCHSSLFDVDQCKRAIQIIRLEYGQDFGMRKPKGQEHA